MFVANRSVAGSHMFPVSVVGFDLQPSLTTFHGKLVCFILIISDIGPLPFSHVILNMSNVVCCVSAKCSIQSHRFHCHLHHLVCQLLPQYTE